jgi:hypothetical protein
MSFVTTLMLHVDFIEESVTLEMLNGWFADLNSGSLLDNTDVFEAWGGGKAPQAKVYAGAFNYFHIEEFMEHLATLPWSHPESVQLFVNDEHDTRFAIYLLTADRTWRQLCDGGGPA